MGGCRCTYRNCTVKSDGKTHMFHYPVFEKIRCHQWLVNAHRLEFLDLKVSQLKNRVVCQHHFKEENFMNYKKDKLTFDAIPTENGPFCDPTRFVDQSQQKAKLYPNLIMLEDIENEVIFNDKKANFSLKYGDFLTNGELMDSSSRYNSDNINLSTRIDTGIPKQGLFKTRYPRLTLPSKADSKVLPQPMLVVPPYSDININIVDGKQVIQEPTAKNVCEINSYSNINILSSGNNLTEIQSNNVPLQKSNEIFVKEEPKIKILSEKKIHIQSPIPVTGKLEKVSPSTPLNIPIKSEVGSKNIKKCIKTNIDKRAPPSKIKVLEILDVEYDNVTPKQEITEVVSSDAPGPNTIEMIVPPPATKCQQLPKTPQIKNKITSERIADIEKKRKFNMRMKDVLETCLDKLDDTIKMKEMPQSPIKTSTKSLLKRPLPQEPDQQDGTHLIKEQCLQSNQEHIIAYLDARLKSMETTLLNKIEQNTQKILELKDTFINVKRGKEPNEKNFICAETKTNEDSYKKLLYKEISQYLSPNSNSSIYEELFINKYSVVHTSPQRKKRRKQ
ncbi:uncharacterized protein LOC123656297 [Melitaea cinxia]|uniref:uncharacterized protein LOC123656297 n=1 Tax=Melitaea cinxia TaxID=113334 RepID=UPI001E270B7D|nr:uncharacterized protein LOC123656297 [Melitaea cinxia]